MWLAERTSDFTTAPAGELVDLVSPSRAAAVGPDT
jgi:hypothetical protein